MKKKKKSRIRGKKRVRDVVLIRVVSISLSGKGRFEQRVEGGEEVNPFRTTYLTAIAKL